ncbi:hypothetical protein BASA81_011602 [Batrachochytrium salamandrivorans]|nr:hypothetical protein BASA81_011602 [Batrachochytrium salamandrivorans]
MNGEADLDQRWLDGTVEHESMGARHDNRALAARLADFLQRLALRLDLTNPVLNSQKDSATLTLLKRQDDSEESPSPDTTPVETDDSYPFNDDNTSSENLASTISKVGDGNASLFKEGDSIAKKIGGDVGDLVARYIRREIYVNVALKAWLSSSLNNVLSTIKSGLGDDQYSKIEPGLVAKLDELKITFNALLNAAIHTTTKILTDDSSVIENVKNLSTSFYSASSACTEIFSELKVQLLRFEVPGLSRDTNPIRGLMYADDVAVFADSEQSLLAASTAIEQWANQWEMQFGGQVWHHQLNGHLAPRLDNPLDIRLHGQLVSRVESYKYLGVLIDSKLDHSAWLKQKRSALEHTILALHPVLANHQLTVNYRSRIFSAVVMGKAYYGLELVGGNKSHLAPLQTTINKGIRLFTGA